VAVAEVGAVEWRARARAGRALSGEGRVFGGIMGAEVDVQTVEIWSGREECRLDKS
jgi:hypothetical protein